jgi:hypothetical protein
MRTLLTLLLFTNATIAGVIDFENLPDGAIVGAQYPGVTFTNATVLTAGISLNEFEFPPHSGANVIFDDGGPITITFSTPTTSIDVYVTYAVPVSMIAFDANNNIIATLITAFGSNLLLSGDPGSTPNERLFIGNTAGISTVQIAGNSLGQSLTLDDLSYASSTPEPSPAFGGLLALAMVCLRRFIQ